MILKKIYCLAFALCVIVGEVPCQSMHFFAITTDVGVLYLIRTPDNRFVLPLSSRVWDKCVAGTSFTSSALPQRKAVQVVIEIANKKSGECNSGIGFSCSIYRCTAPILNRVNAGNRFCPVSLLKNGELVFLQFPEYVDWQSLSGKNVSVPVTKN